ncbi:MAG TPA: MBL fold metallo-hydrolase RNA specificity domain-containing protein [Candidatus Acidoferrales bacterium]|jgi:metallo-beta-lactamase family protein|nr:MBL fold metallo-hydrolase RNA specificity domain-containing protein [Candidatus Acidoferrales bacterium]
MRLTFLGAASTVTGSQYLLETDRAKVLVDCGMFQGNPHEVEHNGAPLAYDPAAIDALLLTHAHLDHCGLIPLVYARGMRAPIFATAGTVELATLVLLDSAKLQEEFAQRGQRRAQRAAADDEEAAAAQHDGGEVRDPERAVLAQPPHATTTIAAPLYTIADAQASLQSFRPIDYGKELEIASGVRATYYDAGHILGSAMIRVVASDGGVERVIVFSGDIGRPGTPIIRDPSTFTDADYVLMESTYGGREHDPQQQSVDYLAKTVQLVAEHKGVLLVPSFAIGRTQEVVFELDRLLSEGKIPRLPLYLDSPMASKATDVYRRHAEYFDDETRALLAQKDDPLDYPGAQVTNDAEDSKKIKGAPRPYMIVASNGMLTGGRVLHHLRNLVDDPAATLLFVGYQGEGTMGAHLQAGATEVKIDGQTMPVRCRVRSISGFSAHADEGELEAWIATFAKGKKSGDPGFPRTVFIVHGDPDAEAALEPRVRALGFTTHVPTWRETVQLA